jgi:hypothetical protein
MKKFFDYFLGGAIYFVPVCMAYALIGLHMIIALKWLYTGISFEVLAATSFVYWIFRK